MHLPAQTSRILDLGCVGSSLTGIASRFGHQVTAVDLNDIEYEMPGVTFHKGDICELKFDKKFDVIMNCSMIEHVGIINRYGSTERNNGDLSVMKKLKSMISRDGKMILTIPVGLDSIYPPFHRIYGDERLPQLLSGYIVLQQEFWAKQTTRWRECTAERALSTEGSTHYYSLGLFVLAPLN